MSESIQPLNNDDRERLAKMREWVVGHFDHPHEYETTSGKLQVIQAVLENGWVRKEETWKLQALGAAFGDALVQEVPELSWVAVDDEYGRDPALRWLDTTTTVFPLTAISKRIEEGVTVDVFEMFGGFQKAIKKAVTESET